jgi:glycosyltransferase involved in cell wall biosynthesis
MSRRPTVTAAVITLNEERNLPGLLERLDWADEVVVVDGGSHDATVELARRRADRILVRSFDTFARQRNCALDAARGDWVLAIDADERPTPTMVEELHDTLRSTRAAAFRVPIRSTIFGRTVRYGGTQDDRPRRLLRRGQGRWSGAVHEVLHVSGPVRQLRHGLQHHTLPDLSAFLGKMNHYTTLAARERMAAGRRPPSGELFLAPVREALRRLFLKHGYLDGPHGWAFCLLSGLSAWAVEHKHRQLWRGSRAAAELPTHWRPRTVPSAPCWEAAAP